MKHAPTSWDGELITKGRDLVNRIHLAALWRRPVKRDDAIDSYLRLFVRLEVLRARKAATPYYDHQGIARLAWAAYMELRDAAGTAAAHDYAQDLARRLARSSTTAAATVKGSTP